MELPANWQDVLNAAQSVWPEAIIAGGALRDMHHNRPIKDVDIFIPIMEYHDHIAWDYQKLLNDLFGVEAIIVAASSYTGGDLERDIVCVLRVVLDSMTYEFIFMAVKDLQESMINKFDLSLCQIGHNGKNLLTTPEFERTLADKTIRVINVNRKDRGAKRLARLSAKYPDYTVEAINEDQRNRPE